MDPATSGSEIPTSLKDPSKLSFQADRTRRLILGSYWLVIFLALPLWWHTTSIERLSLPSSRVLGQAERELRIPVNVLLDESHFGSKVDSIAEELRVLLAAQQSRGVDIRVRPGQAPENVAGSASTYFVTGTRGEAQLQGRQLAIRTNAPDSTHYMADLLRSLLIPHSATPEQDHLVTQYAPRYRLAFTLLNEDAAAGQAILGWDIPSALARHIYPALHSLTMLHNFTIESQMQFHAPLAFTPRPVGESAYGLTPEDLSVFVNSAEWTLSSSVSNDPVLHFVLFIPSTSRRPLMILDNDINPTTSNSFLLPQWGGIVVLNPPTTDMPGLELTSTDLDPIFAAFSQQLLTLLGVPHLPTELHSIHPAPPLNDWQFDALVRRRILENAERSQNTLKSIVKLVHQIENMPVGKDVKGDVLDALAALDKLHASAASSPANALHYSAEAFLLGSRAFFNPGMLALLYFPVEHKYAVYAPLFASALIPLLGAALREVVAWKRSRREREREKVD